MWQFSHGKVNISAAMRDEDWLQRFHDRQIPLYSGDGLRCRVAFTYVYDEEGDLLEQKTEVLKVLEVIRTDGRKPDSSLANARVACAHRSASTRGIAIAGWVKKPAYLWDGRRLTFVASCSRLVSRTRFCQGSPKSQASTCIRPSPSLLKRSRAAFL